MNLKAKQPSLKAAVTRSCANFCKACFNFTPKIAVPETFCRQYQTKDNQFTTSYFGSDMIFRGAIFPYLSKLILILLQLVLKFLMFYRANFLPKSYKSSELKTAANQLCSIKCTQNKSVLLRRSSSAGYTQWQGIIQGCQNKHDTSLKNGTKTSITHHL